MSDERSVDTSETREDRLLGIVNDAIDTAAQAIEKGQIKDVKIPELLKLIQLQKELEEAKPKDINVRWIETWELKPLNEE